MLNTRDRRRRAVDLFKSIENHDLLPTTMGKSHQQVSKFALEGRLLGFFDKKNKKAKQLGIATVEGIQTIDLSLSKKERASLSDALNRGDRVRVSGKRKLNLKTGKLKLKARQVLPASPAEICQQYTSASPCQLESETAPAPDKPVKILICQKSDCRKRGGKAVCQALEESLRESGLQDRVKIKATGCMSRCKLGPNVVVMPDKTRYTKFKPKEVPQLIAKHL